MRQNLPAASVPTPQNSQTHSNKSLAKATELFECV